ncbi:hypothetical protein RM51_06300 [Chryseobacterium taiwanense]|uniref:Uncharacterized protein n=1 Tax=Chryseobacterium taiwanense TaxID=363331 RepID=A0A0B4D6E2_9FLAO|nr:hypothetical protein RM51_06300 [Chryseobacterium taiwanense]
MNTNIVFLLATLFSIYSGIQFGYFDSHTPPPQFLISSLLVIIGIPLIFFRKIIFKNKTNYKLHLIIISVNLIIVLLCFSPLLN